MIVARGRQPGRLSVPLGPMASEDGGKVQVLWPQRGDRDTCA